MVLDGAVDPSLDPIDENLRQMAGFQTAFEDYAADCAQLAGCPLGNDPAQFVNRYHQLIDPLVTAPARTTDPRGLSYSDAITGTVNALYSRQYWKFLTSGLLGLQRKSDPGGPAAASRRLFEPQPGGPLPELPGRVLRHPLRQLAVSDRSGGVGRGRPTCPRGRAVPELRLVHGLCAAGHLLELARPGVGDAALRGSPGQGKVVVVSTTHDPATPYQAGVDLARQMDASLITFDGTQHTVVFNGDPCVDSAVVAFLIDRVQPPAGLRC